MGGVTQENKLRAYRSTTGSTSLPAAHQDSERSDDSDYSDDDFGGAVRVPTMTAEFSTEIFSALVYIGRDIPNILGLSE
jgi:hypothetical protein